MSKGKKALEEGRKKDKNKKERKNKGENDRKKHMMRR